MFARVDSGTLAKALQSSDYKQVDVEFRRNVLFDEPAPKSFVFTSDLGGGLHDPLGYQFTPAYSRHLIAEGTKIANIAVVVFERQERTSVKAVRKVVETFETSASKRIKLIMVDRNGQGFRMIDYADLFPPPRITVPVNPYEPPVPTR